MIYTSAALQAYGELQINNVSLIKADKNTANKSPMAGPIQDLKNSLVTHCLSHRREKICPKKKNGFKRQLGSSQTSGGGTDTSKEGYKDYSIS